MRPALVEATFVARLNRFLALALLDGQEVPVHVANSGRLSELLVRGVSAFLTPAPDSGRKTDYHLTLVEMNRVLVCADARLPNAMLAEAIEQKRLPECRSYGLVRREVALHKRRIDLELSGEPGLCYIEAKSVTLVENDVGLFLDAPTVRVRKHLSTLELAVAAGHCASVAFAVQRPGADSFSVNEPADSESSRALKRAVTNRGEIYAYTCRTAKSCMEIPTPSQSNCDAVTAIQDRLLDVYDRMLRHYCPQH